MRRACGAIGLVITAIFLSITPLNAADFAVRGLSYSPSHVITFSDLEAGISEARLRADLTQLSPITKEIRLYNLDHGLDRAVPIAAKMGMKITLGIWIDRDPAANTRQIALATNVIKANRAAITRVIVGNEVLLHGRADRDQLLAAMAQVRKGIAGTNIPVGTAETWSAWLANPELAAGSDFIAVHIIPYWDGVPAEAAAAYVARRYDEIAGRYPHKPIVIGETGWPASGPTRQAAVPSPPNQARFAKDFEVLARQRGYIYFLVEAYDQPWKAEREGDSPLWGIFDSAGRAKAR